MARLGEPVDDAEFRAELWAGLRMHGGSTLRDSLRLIGDAELAELPCRPALWEHPRSLRLSDVQLDLIWLHWFIRHRKCPIAEDVDPAPQTRVDKLEALLRQAVFPHLGATEAPDYRCSRERRAQWLGLFQGKRMVQGPKFLPLSQRMLAVLGNMEQPELTGRIDGWEYTSGMAAMAKKARLQQADPIGHWVEECVAQFGIAEEFFATRAADRILLLQRVIQPDAPPAGFARIEALPAPADEDTGRIEFRNTGYRAAELNGLSLCTSIVAVRGALRAFREGGQGPRLPHCQWGGLPGELIDTDYTITDMEVGPTRAALRDEACVVVVAANVDVAPAVAKAYPDAIVFLLVPYVETRSFYVQGTNVRVIQTRSNEQFRALRRILTASFVRALFTADYTRLERLKDYTAYDDLEALERRLAEPVGVPTFVVSMK